METASVSSLMSPADQPPELSGMFSYLSNRAGHNRGHGHGLSGGCGRWASASSAPRSLWTKYCLLCSVCGSAATILGAIFLVISTIFRCYTTSLDYFETVPTYLQAILLAICGVSTIGFSCKRNRNIILLRITAIWSLASAALSSVITITTSLIHMNRLQTLKECSYSYNPPACSCYTQLYGGHPEGDLEGEGAGGVSAYVFENTPDCEVIHGILYSSLRAVFAISVVSVLLSIFLCMLLYQLIGHERKKAYWSRIRRINSDWSADFIACLAHPPGGNVPIGWGPPPPYEEVASLQPRQRPPLRLVNSHSENSFQPPRPHPFSPTITSVIDPVAVFRHHHSLSHVDNQREPQPVHPAVSSRGLSMSSITSFSIPATTTENDAVLSSITDANTAAEAAANSTISGGSIFADSLEEFGAVLGDEDASLLQSQLAEGGKIEKGLFFGKITSLPSSPFFQKSGKFSKKGTSATNLRFLSETTRRRLGEIAIAAGKNGRKAIWKPLGGQNQKKLSSCPNSPKVRCDVEKSNKRSLNEVNFY